MKCYEYIAVYVDDLCIAAESPSAITQIFKSKYHLKVKGDGKLTEFRQPLQVQSHLEMPRILVQLGHTQRT